MFLALGRDNSSSIAYTQYVTQAVLLVSNASPYKCSEVIVVKFYRLIYTLRACILESTKSSNS